MSLPISFKDRLENIDPKYADVRAYYGIYYSLLVRAFPLDDGFIVHPELMEEELGSIDSGLFFRVEFKRKAVLVVQVKTARIIAHRFERAKADKEMRNKMGDLFEQSLTEMHGISVLGPKLAFYDVDYVEECITPAFIPRDSEEYFKDTAPAEWWDTDILTDEGYDRFMSTVEHVKAFAVAEAYEG